MCFTGCRGGRTLGAFSLTPPKLPLTPPPPPAVNLLSNPLSTGDDLTLTQSNSSRLQIMTM